MEKIENEIIKYLSANDYRVDEGFVVDQIGKHAGVKFNTIYDAIDSLEDGGILNTTVNKLKPRNILSMTPLQIIKWKNQLSSKK